MAIKRIVGLAGFGDSGKSSVLRGFCKRLIGISGCKVLEIRHGRRIVHSKTIDELIKEKIDFSVVIQVSGITIVIVMAGDKPSAASMVMEVYGQFNLDIDILIVAMRKTEAEGDDVSVAYKKVAMENNIKIKSIFKPGFKRTGKILSEEFQWAESIWIDMLMKETGIMAQNCA